MCDIRLGGRSKGTKGTLVIIFRSHLYLATWGAVCVRGQAYGRLKDHVLGVFQHDIWFHVRRYGLALKDLA